MEVRVLDPAELDAAAQLLARAFAHDPFLQWSFGRAPGDGDHLVPFFAGLLADALPDGFVFALGDRAAITIWEPPWRDGRPRAGPPDERGPTVRAVGAQMAALRPPTPHCYLSVIAADPARRGTGAAAALLADNLARTDALGLATHLESTNPANDGWYVRRGFAAGELVGAPGAPAVRVMRRAAAT